MCIRDRRSIAPQRKGAGRGFDAAFAVGEAGGSGHRGCLIVGRVASGKGAAAFGIVPLAVNVQTVSYTHLVRTFGFYNAGQDCTAACRIYAQQGIYDQLVEKLGAAVASLKMGAPEDAATELGPLSSLAHLERVSAAVEAARALPDVYKRQRPG